MSKHCSTCQAWTILLCLVHFMGWWAVLKLWQEMCQNSSGSSWWPLRPCLKSFATFWILNTSVKTDQLSSNRCQKGSPNCHRPVHSSFWCLTLSVYKRVSVCVCMAQASQAESFRGNKFKIPSPFFILSVCLYPVTWVRLALCCSFIPSCHDGLLTLTPETFCLTFLLRQKFSLSILIQAYCPCLSPLRSNQECCLLIHQQSDQISSLRQPEQPQKQKQEQEKERTEPKWAGKP